MSLELSKISPSNDPVTRRESPHSGSITTSTGNVTVGTLQEDKEYLSSLSQKSSPRLPSILLSPSDPSGSRPRSSEGRVSSVGLPKHPAHLPRLNTGITSSLGPSKRRVDSHMHSNKKEQEFKVFHTSSKADDGLNFGMGEDYAVGPEDPELLADVQRALKAKALREARSKSSSSASNPSIPPAEAAISDIRHVSELGSLAPFPTLPVTPPRPLAFRHKDGGDAKALSPNMAPRIPFPPYIRSPSRSLESISSESRAERSPVPIFVSLPDGSSYLDWSGASPEDIFPQKDRTFLGRTFSITRRKPKEKGRHRLMRGRHSIDLGASQGDLHAAQLDNIRRAAKRETLSRAEVTKDELGRRYNSLVPHSSTGEPVLDILGVVKSQIKGQVSTPWLAWRRQRVAGPQKVSVWAITANSVDTFLQRSGRPEIRSTYALPSKPLSASHPRSRSPSYRLSSPISSSRSSINITPNNDDVTRKGHRRMELNRSFSANPVIEGVVSSSAAMSPALSRSLSLTQPPTFMNLSPPATTEARRSIDAVIAPNSAARSFSNVNHGLRGSLDPATGSKRTEKDSLRSKVRASLSGERLAHNLESRTSPMSSLTQLFNTQATGAPAASSRLHLGVSNMFSITRRSGEESAEGQNAKSRSSVSDERDSGGDGEGTKSDQPVGPDRLRKAHIAPMLDIRGIRFRGKDIFNTSDSELGGMGGVRLGDRLVRRVHRSERDRERENGAEETAENLRDSSGKERRLVDMLATPGWTSKRGVRRARARTSKPIDQEKLDEILRKREEQEEYLKEIYKEREVALIETNDYNRRIARLLKAVGTSIREHELIQSELAQAVEAQYTKIPQEILDATSADPATTLRHGRGWRAVEDSHQRFIHQQEILSSYLRTMTIATEPECSSDLADLIQEAGNLWCALRLKSEEIDQKCAVVKPALKNVVEHMEELQRKYNETQILVETDYREQTRIADLEMIITESRSPRGWLEFAAFWIPEHVLEFIGGFIRFFGVPISEKFIRPCLWYFFRDRYYWKIYSTEPPPNERAWYTRLGYWIVILSILAWYTTA